MYSTLPIPAVYESIERPVVFQVVRQLIAAGIIPNLENIVYQGIVEATQQKGSDGSCDRGPRFDSDGYISITGAVIYEDRPSGIISGYHDRNPLFHMPDEKLTVFPTYEEVYQDLEISFTTSSLAFLRNYVRNYIQINRIGRRTNVHPLSYHYTMPDKAMDWFSTMWELCTQKKVPYSEWLYANMSKGTDILHVGKTIQLAFRESQDNAQGFLEATIPEISASASGMYRTSIRYRVQYHVPSSIVMANPLMVHQQVVPDAYRSKIPTRPLHYKTGTPLDIMAFRFKSDNGPIRIPEFDVAPVPKYPKGVTPILTVLCSLEEDDVNTLFNLRELGDVQINRKLLEVYETSDLRKTMHRLFKGPFLIVMHVDDHVLDPDFFEVDAGLTVKTTRPLSPIPTYRCSFCVVNDFNLLPPEVIEEIVETPFLEQLYIDALTIYNPLVPIPEHPIYPVCTYVETGDDEHPWVSIDPNEQNNPYDPDAPYGPNVPYDPDEPYDPNNPTNPNTNIPDGVETPRSVFNKATGPYTVQTGGVRTFKR